MKALTLLLGLTVFFSCKDSNRPSYSKKNNEVIKKTQPHEGKKLMENKCYVCHSPSASHDDRIAPPMIAIKKHYISSETTKEEFITSLQNFVKNPTKEATKMRGAVKRFGVMPKQAFLEDDIKKIAEYMFDHEIEKPTWFESHFNEEKGKGHGKGNGKMKGKQQHKMGRNLKDLPYSERGLQYALSTKAVLGKNLMGKIQKEGTLAALKFCNVKAYPLTDSMSVYHNASIKRVSDKPRNPKHKANLEELKIINSFKNDVAANKDSEPIVIESSNNVNVYYPIKTNSMCLQCHGAPKSQVTENTLSALKKLYPKDKALGYDINQVRGIWNVSFNKK
ncbi:c-type heme family protein [Polaribacter sp.]|uniref:c-type heme family protein n=1 Tax=Polaribacter sp. TaxID=1920175 RepID=UPI003F6BEDF9